MNASLSYLMDELCSGVEIYYTGRTGGQYLKTAFILCDDYSELVSKLFLLTHVANWTDKKSNGSFKNFHDIIKEVEDAITQQMPQNLTQIQVLQEAIKKRRSRRNDFFHSTNLLDLSVTPRICIEAFCDLLDYGGILFGANWQTALEGTRNLATLELILQLDRLAFSDPSITPKLNKLVQDCPRNLPNNKKKGVHVAEYPEDLHLRLCITWGGKSLRDKMKGLLTEAQNRTNASPVT